MATIRSYTTIEQSRKLAEILPLESADMEYMFLKKDGSKVSNVPFVKDGFEEPECCYTFIPCWSLSALLDVLPKQFGRYTKSLCWFDDAWNCVYMDEDSECKYCVSADNPVDACYELILKLNKLKML